MQKRMNSIKWMCWRDRFYNLLTIKIFVDHWNYLCFYWATPCNNFIFLFFDWFLEWYQIGFTKKNLFITIIRSMLEHCATCSMTSWYRSLKNPLAERDTSSELCHDYQTVKWITINFYCFSIPMSSMRIAQRIFKSKNRVL